MNNNVAGVNYSLNNKIFRATICMNLIIVNGKIYKEEGGNK